MIQSIKIRFAPRGQTTSYFTLYPSGPQYHGYHLLTVNNELIASGHGIRAAEAGWAMCFVDAFQITVLMTKSRKVQENVSCENFTCGGLGARDPCKRRINVACTISGELSIPTGLFPPLQQS